ncbi:purine biosynthesis protein PurH [Clostridium oryzae]|uniref:Purine biosynthesis protein PurH n=1 Tax=Clostridium oryzae TaxID=1450648 RepID=A0A1V4IEB4_9CLOT|nr:purine biosynthesis protein PurH [Clostridium oryzae]OPJ58342.1 hypothetical protein CLORY_36360 [Clostridium oryzae]
MLQTENHDSIESDRRIIEIVKESLGYSDIGCDDCSAGYGYDMYQPYIDGEKELSEISKGFRASYVSEHLDDMSRGCIMGK